MEYSLSYDESSTLSVHVFLIVLAFIRKMTVTRFIVFTFCIVYCISPVWSFLDTKTRFLWKANLAIIPFIEGAVIYQVEAEPTPEEVPEVTPKVKKGRQLLMELNESLGKIKKSIEEQSEVDKDTLEKIMQIKDDFRELQLDPGDLPKKLLDKFKERTFEAFRLILQSYTLAKDAGVEEPEEIQSEPEEIESVDNQVDNDVQGEKRDLNEEL